MSKRWKFDGRYLVQWFRDGSVFWISILIFLAIGAIIYLLPFGPLVKAADRFRYAGLLYEFVGVSLIALRVAQLQIGAPPCPKCVRSPIAACAATR
jgi:hypothetical protein